VPRASGAYTVHRPEHWLFEQTDLRYGDALGLEHTIVAYEVDGVALATGPDGLPVPTHVDGAPESLEVLATAPARLWAQAEQPSRYAHEPGELENTAEALWGAAWPEHVPELANNPRRARGVHDVGGRHRGQRGRHRLGLRSRGSGGGIGSRATCSTGWVRPAVAVEPVQHQCEALRAVRRAPRSSELVALPPGNRTNSTLAPQRAQHREELLALIDRAAQIVLGVQDQRRGS
jgi:hypothetical protein